MKHRCYEIKREHPQAVHDESCTMSYIVSGRGFIGGGNRNTRRKPQTCRKSLTSLIT
jgi:hypothetical protein